MKILGLSLLLTAMLVLGLLNRILWLQASSFGDWNYLSSHPLGFDGAYTASRGELIYVLGDDANGEFSQVIPHFERIWVLNSTSHEWSWTMSKGDIPERRVFYCTSVVNDMLYLFGGRSWIGLVDFNHMYSLHLDTFVWEKIEYASQYAPTPMDSMNCVPFENNIFVYGGNNGFLDYPFWSFDTGTLLWRKVQDFSGNQDYVGLLKYSQIGIYKDSLVMFGGCDTYYTFQSNFYKLNLTTKEWNPAIAFDNIKPVIYGAGAVYKNKFFVFGGTYDYGQSEFTNDMVVINIEDGTAEILKSPIPDYKENYPVVAPSPRYNIMAATMVENLVFIIGGLGLSRMPDYWVFDAESLEWVDSSLPRYPLGRRYPHLASINNTVIALFGGQIYQHIRMPINDLWIYRTGENLWIRIIQESVCPPSQLDCAPAVLHAAFGYFRNNLYLIGGIYPGSEEAIFRKYAIGTERWSTMEGFSDAFKESGIRYFSARLVLDHKIIVWGGMNTNRTQPSDAVYIFHMNDETGDVLTNLEKAPEIRRKPRAVAINNKFCFVDTLFGDAVNDERQIWCLDEEYKSWSMSGIVDESVPDEALTLGFSTSLFLFGGFDSEGNSVNNFWVCDVSSGLWENIDEQEKKPPAIFFSSSILIQSTLHVIGGHNYGPKSSVYTLELTSLWCRGIKTVSSRDEVVTDGSGNFLYFPGTYCEWIIEDTNFVIINFMDVGPDSSLTLQSVSECDEGIFFNKNHTQKISLVGMDTGSVLKIPSLRSRIVFHVPQEGIAAKGFEIKLYSCNKGFTANLDGCLCDADNYINFRGDCISCPSNSFQPLQNQMSCIYQEKSYSDKDMKGSVLHQSETAEVSNQLPPLVHGGGIVINSTIYVIGGSQSSNSIDFDKYHQMNVMHFTNSPVKSEWIQAELGGDIPLPRVHFCFVGVSSLGVLIGGKTQYPDDFVYLLDPSQKHWTRKSRLDSKKGLIGSLCAHNEEKIYIYGGMDERAHANNDIHTYEPATDKWDFLSLEPKNPKLAFGSMIFSQRNMIIFGGTDGMNENNRIFKFDLQIPKNSSTTSVFLNKCVLCDEEGGICEFSRQKYAFGIYDNQLHFFGGIKHGEVLEDINILDIGTSEVTFRQNYGLRSPDIPISNPPPKYGAVSVTVGYSVVIIGGAGKSGIVSNDVWTWNANLQTWSDTSISRAPIHRTEPGFVALSDSTFAIFGGATEYIDEVLLNDLWVFDLEDRNWTCLYPGSSIIDTVPPRAKAMMSFYNNTVYVFGGRTEIGVYDDKIWTFSIETKTWASFDYEKRLSTYQRPLNRVGISYATKGNQSFMWGGKITEGTKKAEFYSAFIGFDTDKRLLKSMDISGTSPSRRQYHTLCFIDNSKLYMHGGVDFSGNVLNDGWIYDTESNAWNKTAYLSDAILAALSNHICSAFDGYSILSGINQKAESNVDMMIQHSFKRQAILLKSNAVVGYERIFKNAGGTMKDIVISFGGKNGHSVNNKVVAYKPGFCSNKPKVMSSDSQGSVFDDGSGSGMYLEGTNCTWILPNATHIIIMENIRAEDRVEVKSLLDGADLAPSFEIDLNGNITKEYVSKNGFVIQFTSITKNKLNENTPCELCDGFKVMHANCPQNANFDKSRRECMCDDGFSFNNGFCKEDLKNEAINTYTIIGGTVGGFFVIILLLGLIYRRKMLETMKGAEKKHMGIIDPNELTFGRLLGSGSFGEVYQGEWRGTDVAIKVIIGRKLNKEQMDSFRREIEIMIELRHPNIVLYMGACIETEKPCLVCELMHHGSLYDVLHQSDQITYKQQLSFMLDISKGMQYLHMSSPPIIHRDLKSLNILVDDRYRLKVSDFGLTQIQGKSEIQEHTGSLLWLAPEVIGGADYTISADVYSFGIICWEILSRKDPYNEIEHSFAVTTQVVMNKLRPTMPPDAPEEIQIIIRDLWNQEPNIRPTFQKASKMISSLLETSNYASNSSFSAITKVEQKIPEGNVFVVCARISESEKLWDEIPESMFEFISRVATAVQNECKRLRGYISQEDEENFVIVFQELIDSVNFCLILQEILNKADWSEEILSHECCKSVADGELRGIRMKMGVDYGILSKKMSSNGQKAHFHGKAVSRALKISKKSHGGQILMSEVVRQNMEEIMPSIKEENVVQQLPCKDLHNMKLYEIYSKKMLKRIEYLHSLPDNLPNNFDSKQEQLFESFDISIPNAAASSSYKTNAPKNYDVGQNDMISDLTEKIELGAERHKIRDKKDWEISIKELSIEKKPLGSGSFGTVYYATYKGNKVAFKKLSQVSLRNTVYLPFLCEVSILRKLHHPNIIQFVGAIVDLPNIGIVTELVEPGNLRSILMDMSVTIGETEKNKIIDGIVSGMAYLHSLNPIVLHRDLKSSNILVDEKFESKICDFGLARVKENNRTMTKCGTMAYQAPEVLKGTRYNEKADVYSFGILLWEIEARESPYQGGDMLALQFEIIGGKRPDIRLDMEKSNAELMARCWDENPERRPNFRDLAKTNKSELKITYV